MTPEDAKEILKTTMMTGNLKDLSGVRDFEKRTKAKGFLEGVEYQKKKAEEEI